MKHFHCLQHPPSSDQSSPSPYYDPETSGLVPAFNQILQFSTIRTNAEFCVGKLG
jgi:exonuclease I